MGSLTPDIWAKKKRIGVEFPEAQCLGLTFTAVAWIQFLVGELWYQKIKGRRKKWEKKPHIVTKEFYDKENWFMSMYDKNHYNIVK